jgi:hypothetical protein
LLLGVPCDELADRHTRDSPPAPTSEGSSPRAVSAIAISLRSSARRSGSRPSATVESAGFKTHCV